MPHFNPIPDPRGSLDPPRRNPPTTLAAATPEPEPEPRRLNDALDSLLAAVCRKPLPSPAEQAGVSQWRVVLTRALDVIDAAVGAISQPTQPR